MYLQLGKQLYFLASLYNMGQLLNETVCSSRSKFFPLIVDPCQRATLFKSKQNTVDSRYLEIEGTLKNSSRYPYFDISDL